MASNNEQKILTKLYALMDRQGAFGDSFPGTPFVSSETEFGLTMGPQNGYLYAMHHLVDSLSANSFFEGKREPKTDMDTMVYTFGIGERKIYDGVVASRTPDGMTLTITTKQPIETTLKALQAGIDAAQARLDRRKKETEDYAQMVRDEFAKENTSSLFDRNTDALFVQNYLKAKTDGYFPGDVDAGVSQLLPARKHMLEIFSDYGIIDTRPRFEVSFVHNQKDYSRINDFHNTELKEIFTAPLAVHMDQNQKDTARIKVEVSGNPSRLAKDIVANDPTLAKKVLKKMGLEMPVVGGNDSMVRRRPGGLNS